MKNWLRAQPRQPTTLSDLQALLGTFAVTYNTRRPHRSLPGRATPATAYAARPKAVPGDRSADTHDRVRTDRIDNTGLVTLRHQGRLYHIGIGRRNPRPAPRPGPAHPRHQRRHRRTPARAGPQPRPRLPAHRKATRLAKEKHREHVSSRCPRCLATSHGGRCWVRTNVGAARRTDGHGRRGQERCADRSGQHPAADLPLQDICSLSSSPCSPRLVPAEDASQPGGFTRPCVAAPQPSGLRLVVAGGADVPAVP
jgi:hypothetical protein